MDVKFSGYAKTKRPNEKPVYWAEVEVLINEFLGTWIVRRLRRQFRTASEALDYAQAVVRRLERMQCLM